MFATVTTWRMAPSLQTEEAQNRILPELTSRALEIARQFGILDFIMIPVNVDTLMVVSCYETEGDARDSGPPLLSFLNDQYGDKLDLLDRTLGPAWEPSDFLVLNRTEPYQWRDAAEAMYGNVNVYQIDPSIREPAALKAYFDSLSEEFLTVLSDVDLLDMLVVRTSEEHLIVLRLFENPDAFDRAMAEAQKAFSPERFAGKITVIENMRGRAFDANFLLRK
jgi:hypothetical protein